MAAVAHARVRVVACFLGQSVWFLIESGFFSTLAELAINGKLAVDLVKSGRVYDLIFMVKQNWIVAFVSAHN